MEPNKKLSPLFFFLSLGVLATLIASVSAFLTVCFETLNKAFPDALNSVYSYGYNTYSFESLRSALAILIIVFPIFLVLQRYWLKAVNGELSTWDQTLKRWALYLILFLASITVVVDLVTLVQYFVSGEITTRFILKVLITLITSFVVGYYYAKELRRPVAVVDPKTKLFAIGSAVLVLFAIIYSFSVMGSPFEQRNLRLDQRRLDDLQAIQWQVINFWQQKQKLPETLTELANPISGYTLPKDPEFEKGKTYRYLKIATMKFSLCADFSLPIPEGWQENDGGNGIYPMKGDIAVSEPAMYPVTPGVSDSWQHDAGPTCFERVIDPELYPPFPKPVR